jgi:hypothetical protein
MLALKGCLDVNLVNLHRQDTAQEMHQFDIVG